MFLFHFSISEPGHSVFYKIAYAPCENSDNPANPRGIKANEETYLLFHYEAFYLSVKEITEPDIFSK